MERLTNAFFIAALGVFAAFALVIAVAMVTGDNSDPAQPVAVGQATAEQKATLDALERAEQKKEARERASRAKERRAILDAEDRVNADRVLSDWQADTWFGEDVWRVKVRRGRVTLDARLDPEPGAEFTASALCRGTLDRYEWATSVRVRYRPPSGAIAARCR